MIEKLTIAVLKLFNSNNITCINQSDRFNIIVDIPDKCSITFCISSDEKYFVAYFYVIGKYANTIKSLDIQDFRDTIKNLKDRYSLQS